jgi:hypothetical protein
MSACPSSRANRTSTTPRPKERSGAASCFGPPRVTHLSMSVIVILRQVGTIPVPNGRQSV